MYMKELDPDLNMHVTLFFKSNNKYEKHTCRTNCKIKNSILWSDHKKHHEVCNRVGVRLCFTL